MKNYKILDLSHKEQWSKYLELLPRERRDIYFTPNYYELCQNNGEGEALCFVYKENNELALYPFLKNSLPAFFKSDKQYFDIQGAYGYNGVVSSTNSKNFVDNFYLAFNQYCRDANIIAEFTRFHPLMENFTFSKDHMSIIEDRNTVWLNLEAPIDMIWKESYSSVNRNMIRKSLKNDIIITTENDPLSYEIFHAIYSNTMKSVNASDYYYFKKSYIDDVKVLLPNNHKLLLAKFQDTIICTMLLVFFEDYAHYHLSGRKREFSNLAGNNLILDQAIRIAQDEGCKLFHFGGGTTSSEKDDLFRFKSNFSKKTSVFYIGKKVHNHLVYSNIVEEWQKLNPDNMNSNVLLKYRYQ